VLLPDKRLLVLLQPLVLDLLLSNQLDGELGRLVDDHRIGLLLSLAGRLPLHDPVQRNGAGIDIADLEQFFADLDFAADDGMHIQSEELSDDELHLGGHESLLDHGVGGDVEVRLVEILLGSVECVLVLILVFGIVEGLPQSLLLLGEGLELLGSDHGVDMGHIAERGGHERSEHLGVSEDVLVEGDGVVGVAQLGLAVGEHTSHPDGAGVGGQPVTAEGGFVLLVEDGVHLL